MSETRVETDEQGVARLRRLVENPVRLLKRIGVILVASSQRAFEDQKFGDIEWDERYPNQDEPKLNLAGALSDLNRGGGIKARRFEARPAGVDQGTLRRSVAARVNESRDEVEVGSTVEYAGKFHGGGESTMPVTGTARRLFAREFGRSTGQKREALKRLSSVVKRDSLTTRSKARPFVGITDESAAKIDSLIREEAASAAEG